MAEASVQRCTVDKYCYLLDDASKSLDDELTEDYREMMDVETKAEVLPGAV